MLAESIEIYSMWNKQDQYAYYLNSKGAGWLDCTKVQFVQNLCFSLDTFWRVLIFLAYDEAVGHTAQLVVEAVVHNMSNTTVFHLLGLTWSGKDYIDYRKKKRKFEQLSGKLRWISVWLCDCLRGHGIFSHVSKAHSV